jgi:cytochrome c553
MRAVRISHPLVLVLAAAWVGPASDAPARAAVSFSRDVKPILARRCFACHGPDAAEGGLRLDQREAALAALESGRRAVAPGDARRSALLARVTAADASERMPPEGAALTAREVAVLRDWIEAGAPWEKHWSFEPLQRRDPPQVARPDRVANPIDAFLEARLEEAGLEPNPPADWRTLARRAAYRLTGLPPSEEELAGFLAEASPEAYARWIDRLLASPHYGEQWGRHWLDAVRYAESNSFERDDPKPNAWKYRDYVIRALNDDKPYDVFVKEQLAGDELDAPTVETMTATGYYRLGIWDDEPADPLQGRYDAWDDIIATTGKTFLGLTIQCARCHDHKLDPMPQADYYGMLAFFADVTPYSNEAVPGSSSQWDASPADQQHRRRDLEQRQQQLREAKHAIEQAGVQRMPAPDQRRSETHQRAELLQEKLDAHLTPAERDAYRAASGELADVERQLGELPPPELVLALARCEPHPPAVALLARGNPHAPGAETPPRFPSLFEQPTPALPAAPPGARSAGRRRVLAEWIASPDNLLTARVIVNRVWHHHFGRGIVRSTSNFGVLGTPPTHPELLDWLALWLIDRNWQLKPLHRLIMTSQAYQRSSQGNAAALARDPGNDLFWRYDLQRLGAEEIRDTLLAVSGQLNRRTYGPSFFSLISAEAQATQSRPGHNWGESTPEERARRSVYIHVKRSLVTPMLAAFDFPDTDVSCEARFLTTQPGQALSLINGQFANEQAAQFALRVARETPPEPRRRIERAVELALQRPADPEEIATGWEFWRRVVARPGATDDDALKTWCLAVLNLNELLYVD